MKRNALAMFLPNRANKCQLIFVGKNHIKNWGNNRE